MRGENQSMFPCSHSITNMDQQSFCLLESPAQPSHYEASSIWPLLLMFQFSISWYFTDSHVIATVATQIKHDSKNTSQDNTKLNCPNKTKVFLPVHHNISPNYILNYFYLFNECIFDRWDMKLTKLISFSTSSDNLIYSLVSRQIWRFCANLQIGKWKD